MLFPPSSGFESFGDPGKPCSSAGLGFLIRKGAGDPAANPHPPPKNLCPAPSVGGAARTACPLQALGGRLHAARPPTFLPAVGHDAARHSDLAAIAAAASRRDLSAAGRAARRPARTRPPGLPAARLPRRFQFGALSR